MAAGILDPGQLTVYRLLQYLLPNQMAHYWFITAYVIMYLFSPVLGAGARQLGQKQLRNMIILLLVFFSVSKSVLPVKLEADNLGYDGLWFICVFLVAAYMRLYGIPFLQKGKRAALCYLGGCLLIYGLTMGVRLVYLKTGRLGNFIHAPYDYNHILNLFAAISLFYAFSKWKLSGEKPLGKLILRVAPYTLGVYLLHEHVELRMLWPHWMGATLECSPWALAARFWCSQHAYWWIWPGDSFSRQPENWDINGSAPGQMRNSKQHLAIQGPENYGPQGGPELLCMKGPVWSDAEL